jgi:hypothetical protein
MNAEEFWYNVEISNADDCWPYVGKGEVRRYGHTRLWYADNGGNGARKVYAHRLAYELTYGAMPEGWVLHNCDNPRCCNAPGGHLLLGDAVLNNRMRDERGRRTPFLPRGVAHWSSKLLSEQSVSAIRTARALRLPATVVASMYGVSVSTIYNVWSGVHYASSAGSAA